MTTTTDFSRVNRHPERARYDPASIHAILDEGLVAHVAFVVDDIPFTIPMAYGRSRDVVYLHGSRGSRLLSALKIGSPVCMTVTLLDGLVLAASAFHHTMNYRSAVVIGLAFEVSNPSEKLLALQAISDHAVPGRWADVRLPNSRELAATTIVALALDQASAKVRVGPPADAASDKALPVWVGEIPLTVSASLPVPDPDMPCGLPVPVYAHRYDSHRAAWLGRAAAATAAGLQSTGYGPDPLDADPSTKATTQ